MATQKDFKVKNGLVVGGSIYSGTTEIVTDAGKVTGPALSVINTDDVSEGDNNQYFTDSRAVTAIKADADWNASNWDTAYGWGDHSTVGYLTSFTETNDLSTAVTWANVPDANITESSVTQHEAALSITESQISDFGTYNNYTDTDVASYLSTNGYATQSTIVAAITDSAPATLDTLNELAAALGDDPNFSTTITNSIATKWTQDNTKISNWDTAYGWGDHSTAGYLTSYTVTESDVTTHQAALSITESQISDLGTYASSTGDTMTGNLNFNDSVKAQFGAGNDLQIYHDGSHSYIEDAGTGRLRFKSDYVDFLNSAGTEVMARFVQNGSASLYHDNTKQLETNADGVEIFGHLDMGDSDQIRLGNNDDFIMQHVGGHTYLEHETTGNLVIRAYDEIQFGDSNTHEIHMKIVTGGAVELNHNTSKKLETTSTGVTVTGTVAATSYTGDGSQLTGVEPEGEALALAIALG